MNIHWSIRKFAKNEKELETLIHTARIYSQDIEIEVGIEKCTMLVMKSEKRHLTDGMKLPNEEKIEARRKENLQILGSIGSRHHRTKGEKEKIKKEYLRRTRKLLETKLYSTNLMKVINTRTVFLVRYLGPFFKWTGEELKQMDQRTRKLMTMHKALHPRDDVDRLYVSRRKGGSGFISIKYRVGTSI